MANFLKLASHSLIVLAIILPTSLLAQKEGFYKELKERADFVFEGEITKSTGKWNAGKTMIYTEHEIKLTKAFKGDLRSSTIKLITLGGEAEGQFAIVGKLLQLLEGYKGVFFAQERPFGILDGVTFDSTTCFANDPTGFVPKQFNENSSKPLGYGAMYQKETYDKVLKELGGVLVEFQYEPENNLFLPVDCSDPTYSTHAEITFQNIEVTGNLEAVELDIMIEASPQGTKFGKCEFFLTFPEQVFGQYVVQNSLLSVTKGDVVQSSDYSMTVVDEAQNKVKISVSLSGAFTSPYSLTGNVEKLFHCSFSIVNPLGIASLTASDFALEGNVWYECHGLLVPFRSVAINTEGDIILPNFENLIGVHYRMQKFYYREIGAIKAIKFDIYASTSENSLFNTARLYIDYGDAFGTSLVDNDKVTTSLSDIMILPTVAAYKVLPFDEGLKTLRLDIQPLDGQEPFLVLTPEPVHILSVTMLLEDCAEDAGIAWNGLTDNNGNTYMEGTEEFQYLPITFDGSLLTPMCGCDMPDPEITGFSDLAGNPVAQVRAGTSEVLKILGHNFGHVIVDGSSFIEVDNADHNPDDRTKILVVDIIDWKNEEITFIVPSTTFGNIQAPMESGAVKVFTECDDSNGMTMDVEYAVTNYRDELGKRALRVALDKQTANGIVFTHSENVGGFERGLTEHAINTWRCEKTKINWSLASEPVASTLVDPDDNVNLVVEVDPNSGLLGVNGQAAVIRFGFGASYFAECPSANGKSYYIKNIDVVINQETNFSNMELVEARRIFLHEFGHAHLLEHAAYHVAASQKLMFWTGANNNAITDEDKNGALTVFAVSSSLLNGCAGVTAIDTKNCTSAVDEMGGFSDVFASPIPFTSGFTIESKTHFSPTSKATLYSMDGVRVTETDLEKNQKFVFTELGHLPQGVYILKIQDGEKAWTTKTIKIQSHE